MPQNLTERLDFKTDFYASGYKSVTQNMKMDILDSAFSAVFFYAILQYSRLNKM